MDFGSWAVLMVAFVLVLYLAQGGVVLSAIVHLSHVAGVTWRADIAPYAHKTMFLYPLALLLLIVLLAFPDHTFPYFRRPPEAAHLNAWHNYPFMVARELLLLLAVIAVHAGFVRAGIDDRNRPSAASRRMLTRFAAVVPFVYFLYGSMVAWDFEMTLTPGWHSAIYAPYFFVGNFQMFLGFFVVWLFLLRVTGRYGEVVADQTFNYLAQMMLGFTLLWTYTFFVQFITIWYGALPDETHRLYRLLFVDGDIRRGPSATAARFWWFVALKSFVPFALLIFAAFRHVPVLVAVVGATIFAGTCLERYAWIAGAFAGDDGARSTGFEIAVVCLVSAGVGTLLWASLRITSIKPLRFARAARRRIDGAES